MNSKSFIAGFSKTAGLGLASVAGKALLGAGKAVGKGVVRGMSGNVTKPLGALDHISAGLGLMGAASQGKSMYQDLGQAAR